MTPGWSRRSFLRLACGAALSGTAGCARFVGRPTATPTRPPVPTVRPDAFALEASMGAQATDSAPPWFAVTLTNRGDVEATVTYGQALMYSAGSTDQPDGLVIVPEDAGERSGSRTDGCWAYTADFVTVRPIANRRTLRPGDGLSQTFAVYDDPDDGACYPPGDYTFSDESSVDDGAVTLDLVVTITIDRSGRLDVAGSAEPR